MAVSIRSGSVRTIPSPTEVRQSAAQLDRLRGGADDRAEQPQQIEAQSRDDGPVDLAAFHQQLHLAVRASKHVLDAKSLAAHADAAAGPAGEDAEGATSTSSRFSKRATEMRCISSYRSPRTGACRPSAWIRPVTCPSPTCRSSRSRRSNPSSTVSLPVKPSSGIFPACIPSACRSRSKSSLRQRAGSIGSSGRTVGLARSAWPRSSHPAMRSRPGQ